MEYFLIYLRKQVLIFYVNCPQWRQFARNVKSYLLRKIRKLSSISRLLNVKRMLKVTFLEIYGRRGYLLEQVITITDREMNMSRNLKPKKFSCTKDIIVSYVQSNFNGSSIFRTMKHCSGYLRVSHSISQEANGNKSEIPEGQP